MFFFPTSSSRIWFKHTITGEGAEGDVLLSGSGGLGLGGHCDCCWWLVWMEYRKEGKVGSDPTWMLKKKVGVCPRKNYAL